MPAPSARAAHRSARSSRGARPRRHAPACAIARSRPKLDRGCVALTLRTTPSKVNASSTSIPRTRSRPLPSPSVEKKQKRNPKNLAKVDRRGNSPSPPGWPHRTRECRAWAKRQMNYKRGRQTGGGKSAMRHVLAQRHASRLAVQPGSLALFACVMSPRVLTPPALARCALACAQRFSFAGLECDFTMLLIVTTIPSLLLLLTIIAGDGYSDEERALRRARTRPPRARGNTAVTGQGSTSSTWARSQDGLRQRGPGAPRGR